MPTVLDDYDIITEVPTPGGMGVVYRARRPDGEITALKLIPLGRTADSDAIVRSERRGAQVQRLLAQKDSHVPRVFDVGEKHGVFFIEMEFIAGEDLSAVLARRGTLPAHEAASIALEIASFLEAAHDTLCGDDGETPAALVHSDLKPSNIRVVDGTGEIKILDFGIAKAGWHTATTNQFGSVPYMSPERIEGRIDRHVDYWALGVVLYEMLTGRLPFSVAEGPSRPERLQQLIIGRCPPHPLPLRIPPALAAIVLKLLKSNRAARYQHASAIKADLAAFLAGKAPLALADLRQPYEGDTIVVARGVPLDLPPPLPPSSPAARRAALPPPLPIARRRRVRRLIFTMAFLALTVDACAVRSASDRLTADLSAATPVDPDMAWQRYQGIRQWAFVPFTMIGVRPRVRAALVTAADRVLADFRRDEPTVRAADWQAARNWLERAVAVGGDVGARARLACAEGHVLRIRAEVRRPDAERETTLRDAIAQFERAARLDPASPDPYLGLARIYSFAMLDFERASAALAEAARRGQPFGLRGHAQLGDASRARADRARRSAGAVRGLPEERSYLAGAAADYEQALAFYGKARGFGMVADNTRAIRRRLAQVRRRLMEIDESDPDEIEEQ